MTMHDKRSQARIVKPLSELLLPYVKVDAAHNPRVSGLQIDSRKVNKGDVFLAYPGALVDGRDYIDAAITKGAVAVLCEPYADNAASFDLIGPDLSIPVYFVARLAYHAGFFAANFYSHPSRHMRVVGITGTNGKTTTSHLVAEALHYLGKRSALIGTLGSGEWGALQENGNTTPDSITSQQQLAAMRERQVEVVVMEVSSHGLDQGRVNGVIFELAALTNVTRDHLDYHGSMAHYIQSKEKLFFWPELKNAVVNLDDPIARTLFERVSQQTETNWYGIGETARSLSQLGVALEEFQVDAEKILIRFSSSWGEGVISNPHLFGEYNTHNLLMALSLLLLLDVPLVQATKALSQVHGVPGRMNKMGGGLAPLVFIDYAHTPDGLLNALQSARYYGTNKLICVFGCGGNRDKGKRSQMGLIAWQFADVCIVTADNPRDEAVADICQHIVAELPESHAVQIIHDRSSAIEQAIAMAANQDVVLIAGKGAERYQEIAGQKIPYSDYAVVEKALARRAA